MKAHVINFPGLDLACDVDMVWVALAENQIVALLVENVF
jgi:hypothetical protein